MTYVFKGVGAEIGGIAAQIAALGRGDFKAFSNIGAAMKEDAVAARKEVNALTARLMNPTTASGDSTPGKGPDITNTPIVLKPVKVPKLSNQICEGQRLIEQLRERLLGTQNLTEVEKLQAQFANDKYSKATAGEKAIALGIAEQIDSRKALQTELDAELTKARELTAEYDKQASRLASLVSGTPTGQNQQRMLDEALAESALRSGDIDTTTYDQIIDKLREVKSEGDDTFKELTQAVNGFGDKAADAITEFVLTGKLSFSDLTRGVVADLLKISIQQTITRPLFGAAAGRLEGLTKSADGNVFSGGSLHQYANTVQTTPKAFAFDTLHCFARGGVFPDAGPEAVMPLSRDSQGVLGVKASGGTQAPSITINIHGAQNAPDVRRAAGQGAWEALAAFQGAKRYS